MKMYNPQIARARRPTPTIARARPRPRPPRGRCCAGPATSRAASAQPTSRQSSTPRRCAPIRPSAAATRATSASTPPIVATLPDLQNGPDSLIKGAKTGIQHVGISNFRLPIRFRTREGGEVQLETSVTGSVSLEADRKGINMSRIMRSFYKHAETRSPSR